MYYILASMVLDKSVLYALEKFHLTWIFHLLYDMKRSF